MSNPRTLHVVCADGEPVVATPCDQSFGYCRAALELEARHEVTTRTMPCGDRLPCFVKRSGASDKCWVYISLFSVVEHMRELLDGKPAAERPW